MWWMTWLMDAFTATEMSLKPSFRLHEVGLCLPSDEDLSNDERAEFGDVQMLLASLRLCSLKTQILDTVGSLGEEELTNLQPATAGLLNALECWKLELPNQFSFGYSQGIPLAMLTLPSMRSLASLYLRYYQVGFTAEKNLEMSNSADSVISSCTSFS